MPAARLGLPASAVTPDSARDGMHATGRPGAELSDVAADAPLALTERAAAPAEFAMTLTEAPVALAKFAMALTEAAVALIQAPVTPAEVAVPATSPTLAIAERRVI